jgi:HAMP domain-containing protein
MVGKQDQGIGLLPKLMLAILIPTVVAFGVIATIYFYHMKRMVASTTHEMDGMNVSVVTEMEKMSSLAAKDGEQTMNQLGEQMIREKAADVAHQIEIFMRSHSDLDVDGLRAHPELQEIAIQPVGKTGYTAVHDSQGVNHLHPNPKIVGMDLSTLAETYPDFWRILEQSLTGDAQGYYNWEDADGTVRAKYMAVAPIGGTDLRVAATTYIDEFSAPAKQTGENLRVIHKRTEKKLLDATRSTVTRFEAASKRTLRMFLIVMGLSLTAVIILTFWFSRTIIRPIRQLTELADRISMGDLRARVEIKSRDEVGLLAESFSRMQESLRAAIERLRKRRLQG